MSDSDVLEEFKVKAQSLLDEAKSVGVEGIVLLMHDDPFGQTCESSYVRNINAFAAIGLCETMVKTLVEDCS